MKRNNNPGFVRRVLVNGNVGTVLFALIALCILWSSLSPYFFTLTNAKNLAIYSAYLGIMAFGFTFPILTGSIDLSQMPLMAMSGMMMGAFYRLGVTGLGLFGVASMTGLLGGAINATLVNVMNIIPFIATVGTQLIFRAFSFLITDGVYVTVKDSMIRTIGYESILGIPVMFWIMLIVLAICWFVLKYTQFGRNLYCVGSSEQAAHLSGINVKKTRFIAYLCSGLMCGIAAVVYTSQSGVALNSAETGAEMDIVTAVVIGGTSMSGGRGSIFNTFLGVILMSVVANGMALLGLNPYFQMLFKGLILVVAVYLDTLRARNA